MTPKLTCLTAIVKRELRRAAQQRGRFLAALIRPILWLVAFATGFQYATQGHFTLPVTAPYQGDISYPVYVLPGLCAMVQLFNGMQSSLSLVNDHETGAMRLLLTSPLPRWWLLFCRLAGGCMVSIAQVYAFLLFAGVYGTPFSPIGYIMTLPIFLLTGLAMGAVGLLLSSMIRQLTSFTTIMNFVVFPTFFLSSALHPIWITHETHSILGKIALINPFTYAVEAIRFGLYGQINAHAILWVAVSFIVFGAAAIWGYNPSHGFIQRTGR